MDKKQIVVLGGGYAEYTLQKPCTSIQEASRQGEITLIDKNRHHILMTELHEVAGTVLKRIP
jgi:NADH dehydrogenase